jgi:hypothetical protein
MYPHSIPGAQPFPFTSVLSVNPSLSHGRVISSSLTHWGDNSIAEVSDVPGIQLLSTAVQETVFQNALRAIDLL